MHALDVLGDPIRRRLVELLAAGDQTAGELTEIIREEFGVGQPAVSNQLRVLRETGFARSSAVGTRRLYSIDGRRMAEVEAWVTRHRGFWTQRLDALDTEITRGQRARRRPPGSTETEN